MNNNQIRQADAGHDNTWADAYLPAPAEYVPQASPAPPMFDTAWLRGALFRQRWVIGVSILIALVTGIVVFLLTEPTYEASATVQVSARGSNITEGQEILETREKLDVVLMTQGEIIKSRTMAYEVASRLNDGALNGILGKDVDENRPSNLSDEQWEERKLTMAAQALQGGVEANIPQQSKIIEIQYRSGDPVRSAAIANAYLDAFVASDAKRNVMSNAYARQYLSEQIEEVRDKLKVSEAEANAYAQNVGIVTQATEEGEASTTIRSANLISINEALAEAKATRIKAEQRWRATEDVPATQLPEFQRNAAIQNLVAERARLNGELSLLMQRYDEQFPDVVDLKSRISLLDRQIEGTSADIKATIRNEFEIARRQEAALEGELAEATGAAMEEQGLTGEFEVLEREAAALREQLKSLLDRYNAVSTAANVQSGTVLPLDRAAVPKSPVSPKLLRNLTVSFVIGLAIAGGLALAREIFIDQLRRAEDIEERLGIPFLGLTPLVDSPFADDEDSDQFHTLVEAYTSIRGTIDYSIPRDGVLIQLTSSQPSEGKSTTALILAELFARMGRKTLLIDADMRKPSIRKLLDVPDTGTGLTEVLLGHAALEEATIEGLHENLSVLTLGGKPTNPSEAISSERFQHILHECRGKYSLVIIDTSPVLGLADAPEIAKLVDGTIFVVQANRTSINQARTAVKRLSDVGGKVIGAVLTMYKALEAGEDYRYQYRYYEYGSSR
ncbi:MAG: polysaccharide biosynthesis tyrosine autokinase [Erythrobacter sp.]|uniref:GumC family protein n=1 Tax=Erythrobacter sp. TaxID=1042 RepID=UPI0032EAD336